MLEVLEHSDRSLAETAYCPPAPKPQRDRPDTFDPQRFLGSARVEIDRFAYLPFGVGPRKCIGSTFALQEATLVLAMIAKYFSFELKPGHAVWPILQLTLRPANGLPMMVRRRSSNGRGARASRRVLHS